MIHQLGFLILLFSVAACNIHTKTSKVLICENNQGDYADSVTYINNHEHELCLYPRRYNVLYDTFQQNFLSYKIKSANSLFERNGYIRKVSKDEISGKITTINDDGIYYENRFHLYFAKPSIDDIHEFRITFFENVFLLSDDEKYDDIKFDDLLKLDYIINFKKYENEITKEVDTVIITKIKGDTATIQKQDYYIKPNPVLFQPKEIIGLNKSDTKIKDFEINQYMDTFLIQEKKSENDNLLEYQYNNYLQRISGTIYHSKTINMDSSSLTYIPSYGVPPVEWTNYITKTQYILKDNIYIEIKDSVIHKSYYIYK